MMSVTFYLLLGICYSLYDTCNLKPATSCKILIPFAPVVRLALVFFPSFVFWGLYFYLNLYPDFWRASWYLGAILPNISSFEDKFESRLFMASRIFLFIDGGGYCLYEHKRGGLQVLGRVYIFHFHDQAPFEDKFESCLFMAYHSLVLDSQSF